MTAKQPSSAADKPKSKRGGARPGAGRKPKSPDDPPSAWRGGRLATRGDITGRAVQAVAASVAEANHWRAKARASGIPFELFFAAAIRDALSKKPRELRNKSALTARGNVRGRVVQAVTATEEEADAWHAMARAAGLPLEAFLAETLRRVLGRGVKS